MSKKRKLDASDLATIIVGLRMFQQKYDGLSATVIFADWPDHFSPDVESAKPGCPLGSEDIDKLCEQLNCGEVEL